MGGGGGSKISKKRWRTLWTAPKREEEGMTEIENSLKQQHKTPFGGEYCKMVYEEGLKMIQETSLCGFWMPLKVKIKDVIIWWNDNWR